MALYPALQTTAVVRHPGPQAVFHVSDTQPVPQVADGQVLVKLELAGLCHSDLNRVYGPLPLVNPIVGHEGVGQVVKLGANVSASLLHQRVGLGWLSEACLDCEICEVDYTSCPQQRNLGRDLAGTFQQYIAVSAAFVHPLPDGLSAEVAAPLLCAGITMYSAMKKTGLQQGQWLLLPGAGGGLGHLGVQIAAAMNLKVIAVDTGADKRGLCLKFGASAFIDYKTSDVVKETLALTSGYGAHAVVCISGARAAYEMAVQSVRNTGTVVCIGVSPTDIPVSALDMVRRGLRLIGSAVGTRTQMQELLKLGSEGKLVPITETVPFTSLDSAARRLERGEVIGRLIVKIPS